MTNYKRTWKASPIIYILKYKINLVFKHKSTNTKYIHFEFVLGRDMNDGLCGSVSSVLELIMFVGL